MIYHKEGLDYAQISPIVRSQSRLIKTLTFLEFALATQRKELGPGKNMDSFCCAKIYRLKSGR